MKRKRTVIIIVIILLAAVSLTAIIFLTEPTTKMEGASVETAMLVDITRPVKGNFRPVIVTTGTVQASQDIILSPRVSGQVIRISPLFTPGGYVKKGQVMLQIDPSDYENILEMRKSDLQQAEADLNIEMGRQNIARQDYELLEESLAVENESLVLREPQLNASKSKVEAARASVKQAELDLERTTIRAPFDAHVLSRNVHVGSQVSPGEDLGRLVGMDVYWIEAAVPLSKLRWLSFPTSGNSIGSAVIIRNRTAWNEEEYRTGYLYKLLGALDNESRFARVLVSVSDPLAQKKENDGQPALIIGEFLELSIQADEIADVIRLNRDYVRNDETVWIMEDGKLRIRDLEIVFSDSKYAYVSNGLNPDDQVVTTNLTTVTDGVSLRTEPSDTLSNKALPVDSGDQAFKPLKHSEINGN